MQVQVFVNNPQVHTQSELVIRITTKKRLFFEIDFLEAPRGSLARLLLLLLLPRYSTGPSHSRMSLHQWPLGGAFSWAFHLHKRDTYRPLAQLHSTQEGKGGTRKNFQTCTSYKRSRGGSGNWPPGVCKGSLGGLWPVAHLNVDFFRDPWPLCLGFRP